MADEVKRCAECTCEYGGIFCNWIASTPRAYLAALTALQAQNRKLLEALTKINVGEGWAALIARAAIAEAEKGEG